MDKKEITLYFGDRKVAASIGMPLRRVIDLTWDRRDRGGEWLVVERGLHDGMLIDTGRLLATSVSLYGANNRAGKARARLRRRGLSGRIDVVRRGEVKIDASRAAYGVNACEG